MNRSLLIFTLPALLAAAPTPLLVGSVRDQYGLPISGAQVRAGNAIAQTDAQGTFALQAANVERVLVTCSYCQPLAVTVNGTQPIVAIVRRYDPVALDSPTERDIASVPYARAESLAALTPFAVLETTSRALPGPQISDRGASPRGALVFDDGIPRYDVATNQSPFVAFPLYTAQSLAWRPPADAFLYGDLAGGGTLLADTWGSATAGIAGAGSESALRAGQITSNAAWSAGASRDSGDQRARADGFWQAPIGADALKLTAAASQDDNGQGAHSLDTSARAIRLDFSSARENTIEAALFADGGGYDGTTTSGGYAANWSDVQAQASVETNAPIRFFAGASARLSTGYYALTSADPLLASGTIAQTQVYAGARTAGERYSAQIGVGGFSVHYGGGTAGAKTGLDGGILVPSLRGSYALDPHWTLGVQAGESFTLPTLLEAFYDVPGGAAVIMDRNTFFSQTLEYGDLERFRAAFTTLNQSVTGLDNGTIASQGVSVAWQIAPAISLRAWLLHDGDLTQPYRPLLRFGAQPEPATVSEYWLTYESPGMRVDALYRRDLLDYRIDPHFDASLSVPIARGWRAFAATERYTGTRYLTFGVRAETP